MATNTRWQSLFFTICLLFYVDKVNSSAEVLKKMSVGFMKVLEECKKELNVQENIMQDFVNFWREDYQLLNREMGCVILCMASKMDLLNVNEYKMHHENAHAFAKSHGADDEVAKQLVDILHDCEKQTKTDDHCSIALEVAKCFRTKIHELKWAPDMEIIIEEVMTEAKNI